MGGPVETISLYRKSLYDFSMLPKSVAAILQATRKTANIRQAELGLRVGVSRQQISNIENGRSDTTIGRLMKLAEALDLDVILRVVPRQQAHLGQLLAGIAALPARDQARVAKLVVALPGLDQRSEMLLDVLLTPDEPASAQEPLEAHPGVEGVVQNIG